MFKYTRYLTMHLPQGQSAFLWGARKTGKSFYLREHFKDAVVYNLLETDTYMRLLKQPHVLREEIKALAPQQLAQPIVIDEVQKIPALLDEVHLLIETTPAYFILCGSSARKLKATGVNLLGGRAWRYVLYPLVYPEIPHFHLLRALNDGLIPAHYNNPHWGKTIKAYVQDYVTEEIKAESLIRNLQAFAKFLDVAAWSNGELINHSNIAQDCGVDAKTVKAYYQILEDTLLGYHIQPFQVRNKRKHVVAAPKFYFFDVGVVRGLTRTSVVALQGAQAGAAFEHYVLMELVAYRGLHDREGPITFWRTHSGLEVDFVLGDAEVAIEVKISDRVRSDALRGLVSFVETYAPRRAILVSNVPTPRVITPKGCAIDVWPWRVFLDKLWAGEIW